MRTCWRDPHFSWLEDPREISRDRNLYRFPGKQSIEFARKDVVNHHANLKTTLCYGGSIQGLSLAVAFKPMPDYIRHGEFVSAILNVVDQFENQYSSRVNLWVDRSARIHASMSRGGVRKRLFDDLHNVSEDRNKKSEEVDGSRTDYVASH